MTDGYLSKDRAYLAAMQRERRARIVRIDYMPSKAARDAIEAMRARSRPRSVLGTNSAVIDAIVAEWARLTGIQQSQVAKPVSPARSPVLSGQCAHAHKGSAAHGQPDASQARVRANNFGHCPTANSAGQPRMICGAKRRRDGQPCRTLSIPGKLRCKWHGGASTGPRTDEGRARSLANLRQNRSHDAGSA